MANPALSATKETHGPIMHAQKDKDPSAFAWPRHLLRIAQDYLIGSRDHLYLEEATDFVKRDLGFLDGHASYHEENRMH